MANIRKFLDLSTAHLDRSDKKYLDACAMPGSIIGVAAAKTEYGWFVYAPEEPEAYSKRDLPPHMWRISAYARMHSCEYILLDTDADIDPALPIFDERAGARGASRPAELATAVPIASSVPRCAAGVISPTTVLLMT
jgi:hypothetical protein